MILYYLLRLPTKLFDRVPLTNNYMRTIHRRMSRKYVINIQLQNECLDDFHRRSYLK